jgi:putative membrane protein
MYLYVKALHVIFIVTWFAGLFYIVRLFIYNREAQDKPEAERKVLQPQFEIMIKRLWLGITWPSCVLAIVFGTWLVVLLGDIPGWLQIKLAFVAGLLLYHLSLHALYRQQLSGVFKYTSQQLRAWNEVATVFLVAVVILVEVKTGLSVIWGLIGLIGFVAILLLAIAMYKRLRDR